MAGPVSRCLGPAPEDKEYPAFLPAGPAGGCLRPVPEDGGNRAFFPSFFSFWQVLFGSLKGTGTPILGKQGSKTGERVPETGA